MANKDFRKEKLAQLKAKRQELRPPDTRPKVGKKPVTLGDIYRVDLAALDEVNHVPNKEFTRPMFRQWVRSCYAKRFGKAMHRFGMKDNVLLKRVWDDYSEDVGRLRRIVYFGMTEWMKRINWPTTVPTVASFYGCIKYIDPMLDEKPKGTVNRTGQYERPQEAKDAGQDRPKTAARFR